MIEFWWTKSCPSPPRRMKLFVSKNRYHQHGSHAAHAELHHPADFQVYWYILFMFSWRTDHQISVRHMLVHSNGIVVRQVDHGPRAAMGGIPDQSALLYAKKNIINSHYSQHAHTLFQV